MIRCCGLYTLGDQLLFVFFYTILFSEDPDEEDEDSGSSSLVDGNTYITYISGNSIIRVNKDDPSDKARVARPGIRNLIVEPGLRRVFYTRGSGVYSEPLDFTDNTGELFQFPLNTLS